MNDTSQLSKSLMCIQMRSGVEIWVENERADRLQEVLANIAQSKFIRFEDQTFNSADIVGVFQASTMADVTRRKNGMWQCQLQGWHDRGEKCACLSKEESEKIQKRHQLIKVCGKCVGGFVFDNDSHSATLCECQK